MTAIRILLTGIPLFHFLEIKKIDCIYNSILPKPGQPGARLAVTEYTPLCTYQGQHTRHRLNKVQFISIDKSFLTTSNGRIPILSPHGRVSGRTLYEGTTHGRVAVH